MLRALGVDVRPGAESPGIKEKEWHELTGQPFHRRSRSPRLGDHLAHVRQCVVYWIEEGTTAGGSWNNKDNTSKWTGGQRRWAPPCRPLCLCSAKKMLKTIQRLLSPAQTREKRTTTKIADRLFLIRADRPPGCPLHISVSRSINIQLSLPPGFYILHHHHTPLRVSWKKMYKQVHPHFFFQWPIYACVYCLSIYLSLSTTSRLVNFFRKKKNQISSSQTLTKRNSYFLRKNPASADWARWRHRFFFSTSAKLLLLVFFFFPSF